VENAESLFLNVQLFATTILKPFDIDAFELLESFNNRAVVVDNKK